MNINRLFLKGSKNVFKIIGSNPESLSTNDQSSLSRISSVVPQVPNLDISLIASNQEPLSEDESLSEISNEDVHNIDRPILLRQFAEAVVRAAYLKYANGGKLLMDNVEILAGDEKYTVEKPKSQIGIALLKLFNERLVPYGGKRTCKSPEEEVEIEEGINSLDFDIVDKIFNQYSRKDRSQKEKKDCTIIVQSILQLLKDSFLIPSVITFTKAISLIERFHDADTSYSTMANSKKSEKVKNRVLSKILGLELTLYEFYEFLVLLAFEVIPKDVKNTDEEFSAIRVTIERFLNEKLVNGFIRPSSEKNSEKHIKVSKTRVFPKSAKQLVIDARNKIIQDQIIREENENRSMLAEDFRL